MNIKVRDHQIDVHLTHERPGVVIYNNGLPELAVQLQRDGAVAVVPVEDALPAEVMSKARELLGHEPQQS